jgi:hypothetical protein
MNRGRWPQAAIGGGAHTRWAIRVTSWRRGKGESERGEERRQMSRSERKRERRREREREIESEKISRIEKMADCIDEMK